MNNNYVHGTTVVHIKFPKGDVVCHYCRMLTSDRLNREVCCITGEIMGDSDYERGTECPLLITGQESNDHEESV